MTGGGRPTLCPVLGSDREALLTWPVVVASRILPLFLVAVAIGVPAGFWSQLPSPRPGPLLITLLPGVIGVFITLPQAVRPVVMDPEPFLGPLQSGYLPGLGAAFVRTKLGRLALGIFFLSEAAARAVGLTVINRGADRWQSPALLLIAGLAASFLLAAAASLTLRRYGRGRPSVIPVPSYERTRPLGKAKPSR